MKRKVREQDRPGYIYKYPVGTKVRIKDNVECHPDFHRGGLLVFQDESYVDDDEYPVGIVEIELTDEQVRKIGIRNIGYSSRTPITETIESVSLLLEGAVQADEHTESLWISVTERLPENDFNCIVTNEYGRGVNIAYYVKEEKLWHTSYSGEAVYGVTHWMKLPEII